MPTETTPRETIEALGLTVDTVFVPWRESRNYEPNTQTSKKSLNWRVTVQRNGQEVLTTDYSAGIAHCPSYRPKLTLDVAEAIEREIARGRVASVSNRWFKGAPILPKPEDVLYGLVMDASAIDHPTYESWAGDYGYDPDSRSGEATYRACLEIGLKLRAALGEAGLAQLREAFANY